LRLKLRRWLIVNLVGALLRAHIAGPDLPNFNLGVSASLGEEEWGDPIPPLARELALQAPLLCFDEFQVLP
jgi:hypothetical protein